MRAYREPGRHDPTCTGCGVTLTADAVYFDGGGNVICRACQARGTIGAGERHIRAWNESHSRGMYVGAAVVTAVLLGLGLLRHC